MTGKKKTSTPGLFIFTTDKEATSCCTDGRVFDPGWIAKITWYKYKAEEYCSQVKGETWRCFEAKHVPYKLRGQIPSSLRRWYAFLWCVCVLILFEVSNGGVHHASSSNTHTQLSDYESTLLKSAPPAPSEIVKLPCMYSLFHFSLWFELHVQHSAMSWVGFSDNSVSSHLD